MTDISVQNIRHGFEVGENVLDGLSFEIFEGEHVGILGRNGAGKTTLFRIITGEITPDEGGVIIPKNKRVGVLSQIPNYAENMTAEDVLKTAHERVFAIGREMRELEEKMSSGDVSEPTMKRYDFLSHEFDRLGGYELERLRDLMLRVRYGRDEIMESEYQASMELYQKMLTGSGRKPSDAARRRMRLPI